MDPYDTDALQFQRGLVARMAAGDAEALRALYELQVTRVYGIVMRILGDGEEARDVVQEVFVKAWRNASQYRPERGEVVAWLVLLARNSAIDRRRRAQRQNRLLDALARHDTGEFGAPSTGSIDSRQLLEGPLASLSAAQRQALELAFFAGYSQPEIADRMRITVSNVKNHLRRGLLKLRQSLADHE